MQPVFKGHLDERISFDADQVMFSHVYVKELTMKKGICVTWGHFVLCSGTCMSLETCLLYIYVQHSGSVKHGNNMYTSKLIQILQICMHTFDITS